MPPLPNVNKVIRLDFRFTLADNVPALSRQFYSFSGNVPTLGNMNAITAIAVASFETNGIPEFPSDYRFKGVEGTDLTTSSGAQFDQAVDSTGSRAGTFVPQSAAAVIAYKTLRRYRGGHPRGYWPFGTENDLADEALWEPSFVTEFQTAIGSVRDDIIAGVWSGGGTMHQVNVSYYHGFTVVISPTTGRARNLPTARGVPLVDQVTTYVGRERIGTQRRRLG